VVWRILCPHILKLLRGVAGRFHARHNCADFDGFSLNYVASGGSVSIDPGCLDRFFLVQLPVAGWAQIETASRGMATAPGMAASLLSPTIPTAWCPHHRHRLRSRLHPSRPDGRCISAEIRRDAVGNAAPTQLNRGGVLTNWRVRAAGSSFAVVNQASLGGYCVKTNLTTGFPENDR
jgi:hypothetical protein